MVKGKTYKLKITAQQGPVIVADILRVLNAVGLTSSKKSHVERHEVGEIVFETLQPIAFDVVGDIAQTGRFVLVDNYEIAGGGIILGAVTAVNKDRRSFLHRGRCF